MITAVNILTARQKKDIKNLLVAADKEFVQPLSERHDTTQKTFGEVRDNGGNSGIPQAYFDEMLKQSFILCLDHGRVIGFMSYRKDYNLAVAEQEFVTDYVSTIIVSKAGRNKGYTQKMYQKLFEYEPGKVYSTRTWSTNYSHIHVLEKLGFSLIERIKNGRGSGIDTVYYVKRN